MKKAIILALLFVAFSVPVFSAYTYCVELQSGTVCLNGTILTGTKINASDVLNLPNSSGSDGNNYTTGIAFVQNSTTYTLQLSRSGSNNLSASFTIPASGGSSDVTVTAGPNWPIKRNATNSSVLEDLSLTCAAGYALSSVTNNSVCTQFETPASAAATYYPLTNPAGYNTGTVTNVATGNGLTGGPITTTGTISVNATTCTSGNYTQWNGTAFNCQPDTSGGGTGNATDNTANGYIPVQTGSTGSNFTSSLISADSTGQLKYNANGGPGNWTQRGFVDFISESGGNIVCFVRSNTSYACMRAAGGTPFATNILTRTTVSQSWIDGSLAGTSYSLGDTIFGNDLLIPTLFADIDRRSVCINCNTTEANFTVYGNSIFTSPSGTGFIINTQTAMINGSGARFQIKNQNGVTYSIGQYQVANVFSIGNSTATTPAINILQDQKIGIGTTTPSTLLTLADSGANTNLLTLDRPGVGNVSFTNTGGGPAAVRITFSNTTATSALMYFVTGDALNFSGGDIFMSSSSSSQAPAFFYDHSAQRIGIKTNQPSKELEVAGSVGAQEFFVNNTGVQAQLNLKMPVHSFNVTCAAGTIPISFAFNADGTQNGTTCVTDQTGNGSSGGGGGNASLGGATAAFDFVYVSNSTEVNGTNSLVYQPSGNTVFAPVLSAGNFTQNNYSVPVGFETQFWGCKESELLGSNLGGIAPFSGLTISSGTINQQVAGSNDHLGVIALQDSTTANGGTAIGIDFVTTGSMTPAAGDEARGIFQMRTGKAGNVTARFGFSDSVSSADAVDGCFLETGSSPLNRLTAKCRAASVTTVNQTTFAFLNNTWYGYSVKYENTTKVNFTVWNDTGAVAFNVGLTSGVNTAASTVSMLATQNTTDASAALVWIDYFGFCRQYKPQRAWSYGQ